MALLTITIFGGALTAAVWAMFTTIRPELQRIADLLANGPAMTSTVATLVPARSTMRDVRVQRMPAQLMRRVAA